VELFIPTAELARGPGPPFYTKLNDVLKDAGFDPFVEALCAPFDKDGGRNRLTAFRYGTRAMAVQEPLVADSQRPFMAK